MKMSSVGTAGAYSVPDGGSSPPSGLLAASTPFLLLPQLPGLALPAVVLPELLDETRPERLDGGEEGVELVQGVGAAGFGVDVEIEADAVGAVRDLEDRPRLEVAGTAGAVVVVVALSPEATFARVLD